MKIMSKRFNNPVFWGILLIVLGILFSLRSLWGIHIPVFRIIIALFLIRLGIVLVMGRFGFRRGDNFTIFSELKIIYNPAEKSYGCIFGKLDLDLTTIDPSLQKEIDVLCTFGEVNINVSKDAKLMIVSNTLFGETKIPDNREYNFGSGKYQSVNFSPDHPYLLLKTKCVFGSVKVYDV